MTDITLTDHADAPTLDSQVAQLLAASRAAHDRAKSARHHKQPDAAALLTEARDLRLQAVALDPEFTAEAWAEETIPTQAQYLAFYQRQLS